MDHVTPSKLAHLYGSVEPSRATCRSSSSCHPQLYPISLPLRTLFLGASTLDPSIWPLVVASSSYSAALSAPAPELDPFRDVAGFLPLVPCSKWGTKLIGRVSQKVGSKGKRFYKCPLLEHESDYCCVDLRYCLQWSF